MKTLTEGKRAALARWTQEAQSILADPAAGESLKALARRVIAEQRA